MTWKPPRGGHTIAPKAFDSAERFPMADIKVLPTHLVNKIAAGEVVERPASVVKELVENALDAGASSIDVTVEDGGRRAIIVRDDGAGMGPEDLALVFAPHATSKIADDEDLWGIRTMGFRGEALASIASVSHASVLTRRRGSADPSGYEVRADGETIGPPRPAAAADGTTVTVRDLFFNTPARRKFMRTAATEFGHIVEQLARLALPHGPVAFSLTHNERLTHRLPAARGLRQRVADFFGADLAGGLVDVAGGNDAVRISGLIGHPSAGRASARMQYFFVNGRYVRDRTLAHAVKEAYRGLIDPSRSPVAMVFVEVSPEAVDVNVHPMKTEVRFRDAQRVHSEVLGVLREALSAARPSPAVAPPLPEAKAPAEADAERTRSLKQAMADFFRSVPPRQPALSFPRGGEAGPATAPPPSAPSFDAAPPAITPPPAVGPGETMATLAREPAAPPPRRRTATQLHNMYIVAATGDGVEIIDQHALHERIIFEDLRRRLDAGALASQRLLIPQPVEASAADQAILAERADLLTRLGVEVGAFGPTTVAIQAFPALLAERKVLPGEFLRDLLDLLADQAGTDADALIDRVLATMACHAAVKAGDPLADEEIEALLARRQGLPRRAACPHGRPTSLTLTLSDLQKQFRRTGPTPAESGENSRDAAFGNAYDMGSM